MVIRVYRTVYFNLVYLQYLLQVIHLRVSYSLLCSLNLKQLISNNEEEYFNKIDYYCTNRNELKKIRDYLIKFKEKNFTRMVKFTKDFEDLII